MLSRGLVHDFFTQDPADRSCGEESCAKWFIGREGIGNLEDAGFGAFAIHFRYFVLLCVPVQMPRSSIDLPGRDQNLKLIKNRERLQMRIGGRQRGLKKTVSCAACVRDVSGQEPGIARFEVRRHSPDPMQEKFCGHLKVLYVPEMFKCLRVFPFMERHVSSGDLVNCVVLSVWILSPRITARLTNSPCTLEVESQGAKPCFAEGK